MYYYTASLIILGKLIFARCVLLFLFCEEKNTDVSLYRISIWLCPLFTFSNLDD